MEHLSWRYAAKEFDSKKELNQNQLELIKETLRYTPSSFGLQPWKFVLVKDKKIREELFNHAWNQNQIKDASELVVLCRLKIMDKEHVDKFVEHIAKERNIDINNLQGYRKMMLESLEDMSLEEMKSWMDKQVYIALGFLLNELAHQRIDSCPMEGFNKNEFDRVLNLDKYGLESVVICPVGFRSEDDKYANIKKVRFNKEDLFVEI